MTAFTVPIVYDKIVLVIPKPGSNELLSQQVAKVLQPFTYELWGLVLAIIVVSALLSVWFSDSSSLVHQNHGLMTKSLRQRKRPLRRRKRAFLRLAIDSFLEKGIFFFSAGVEQGPGASLPNKLLMFGFAFFILISVSAYVANLAAFLTRKSIDGTIATMEGAVAKGWNICAHPVIKTELGIAWPKANFVFSESGKEFHGMLDDYADGKCGAMAISW